MMWFRLFTYACAPCVSSFLKIDSHCLADVALNLDAWHQLAEYEQQPP